MRAHATAHEKQFVKLPQKPPKTDRECRKPRLYPALFATTCRILGKTFS